MIFNLKDTEVVDKVIRELNTDVSILENELTANGVRIYLDYKDGKYGYNTSEQRGADTFNPFKSDPVYTLNTVKSVAGNNLGTITGCGYISIKRIKSGTSSNRVSVYIDGSTVPFKMAGYEFYFFHFTKSIRFDGGVAENSYFYQTKLTTESKYTVQQGAFGNSTQFRLNGKGKVIIISTAAFANLTFNVDGLGSMDAAIDTDKPYYIEFNNYVVLNSSVSNDYIAYLEN